MTPPLLPPGQQLAAPGKWPLVGERACPPRPQPWTVEIVGAVRRPQIWTLDELNRLPQVEQVVDIHCVTRWSKLGARFRGAPLASLISACEPTDEARYVSFTAHSERNHSTSLTLHDAQELQVLVALEFEGSPLPEEHGGPVRVVTPGRYFYKSLKWLRRIELLAEDRLGYWESEAGYHNRADPWREERYLAPTLDRREAARLITTRDLRGRDLRGIDAAGRDLENLNAQGSLLRNADFRRSNLRKASFAGANLSNAHLQQADLRDADFQNADLEGADFTGADLRGADLTGASLFGATFASETEPNAGARLDHTTRMDRAAIEQLAPLQREYVLRSLRFP